LVVSILACVLVACDRGPPTVGAVEPASAASARPVFADRTAASARPVIAARPAAFARSGVAAMPDSPAAHAAFAPSRSIASDRAASYARRVEATRREREALASSWRSAPPAERDRILERAGAALQRSVAGLLPAWDGTPYARDGVAARPGRDPIGCGFLVSTALRGAGLRVERARLAQQAAEDIVLSLVPAERVVRERRVPLGTFLARVTAGGDGVYIVGLDRHVGFLIVEGDAAYFHHASHLAGGVIRERALLSPALATSHYRVVGKLDDRALARAWLEGAAIPTVSRRPGGSRAGSWER
jgi:hypothetical protein